MVLEKQILSHMRSVAPFFFFAQLHPCAIRFPGSTATSPISPAFNGEGFSLAAPMRH